jgi:hypothetical protein
MDDILFEVVDDIVPGKGTVREQIVLCILLLFQAKGGKNVGMSSWCNIQPLPDIVVS